MTTITLDPTSDLSALVAGPVLWPGDADYAAEVGGFNVLHRPTPAVVVGALDAADVAATVRWAAGTGRTVVPQSTGHGLVDDLAGTVMISTRRLDSVAVDPIAKTARVGAGTRWRAVIDAAAPYGLAPLCGSASGVGVVGYTLGGGMGLLARQHGFAADHVRRLTVVTADGEIRTVDAERHPDLFWALRGGKVGLGIVTDIEFALFDVETMYAGGLFFPGDAAPEVLYAWRRWAPGLPESVTTSVALLRLPPDPQLPPPLQGQFVVHVRFASTDAESAPALLAPMRSLAPILLDTVDPALPFAAVDAVHMDPPVPMPAYDRGLTLRALDEQAVEAVLATAGPRSDSALTLVELRLMGGALGRPAASPNAVPGRDSAVAVYVLGVPAGPAAALIPAQVGRVVDALRPLRAGGLPNFLGHATAGERRSMWPEVDRQRLRETAAGYDAADLFGAQRLLA